MLRKKASLMSAVSLPEETVWFSMVQFKVGYYLFAILFLMFDVETVFLFPWAVIAKGMGVESILAVCVFLFVLILGLAYAWRKGALQWK